MVVNWKEYNPLIFISAMVPAKHTNFPAKKFYFALVVPSLIKLATRKIVSLIYFDIKWPGMYATVKIFSDLTEKLWQKPNQHCFTMTKFSIWGHFKVNQ